MTAMRLFAISLVVALVAAAAGAGEPEPARPDFPDLALIDSRGGVSSLKSSLGRATVLNFWATWCGPCRIELPELQELYNELGGKGVAVLAINVDSPREHVSPFLKRFNLSLPVFFIDEESESNLGIRSLPTTVLLDAGGKVVKVWGGYSREGMLDLRQRAESLVAGSGGHGGK